MAGRPKYKQDMQILGHIVPSLAAEIYSLIESGKSLTKTAEHVGVSKSALSDWLEEPDRIELYKRARVRAANRMAEATVEIADRGADGADGVPAGEPDVQRDKLRIQTRQWLASRWDRETYGESKGPQVQINLASLHIDALRRYRAPEVATLPKCIEGIAIESE